MIGSTTLLWVGTVALVATFGGLRAAVPRYRNGESSLTALFAYGFGLMFWILFTLHSTGYVRMLGGGVSEQVATQSFTVAGVLGALTTTLLLFDAAARTISSNAP